MSEPKQSDSIFWIEVEKIKPNPFQPRREFDSRGLEDLADSIRQYGVLQPLTVTRHEEQNEDGLSVYYELIAGERRLRASKLAGLAHVPAIIRTGEETDKMKLELAIIENLQREDLNPMEKAHAFKQLTTEFGLTHAAVGKRMGKSREYVSNALRLLQLPEYVQQAVGAGRLTEGHARPLMMLRDQPEERDTLFKEILYKKMSVRDAEKVARSIAKDKVRRMPQGYDPKITEYEKKFSEGLGTRVSIEKKKQGDGGKIVIDYFSPDDLESILEMLRSEAKKEPTEMMNEYIQKKHGVDIAIPPKVISVESVVEESVAEEVPEVIVDSVAPDPVAAAEVEQIIEPELVLSESESIDPVSEAVVPETAVEVENKSAASLDSIFGEGSPMAFDIAEAGVEDERAQGFEFEDEEEDDDMDEYYAQLMFGSNPLPITSAKSAPASSAEKTQSPDKDESIEDLGDTLGELDAVTSHDIKEEI